LGYNTYVARNVIMKLSSYLKQTKMSSFKNRGQEGKSGPVRRLVPVGGGRIEGMGVGG
jgi:hypothetical protein